MAMVRIYKPIYMCLRGEEPGDEASPKDNWNVQVKGQQEF